MINALALIELAGGAFLLDLARLGLRIENISWSQATVIVTELLHDNSSATCRRVKGEESYWSLNSYLLAHIADTLTFLAWGLGGRKGAAPKPISRPGMQRRKRLGRDSIKISDFNKWWSSRGK